MSADIVRSVSADLHQIVTARLRDDGQRYTSGRRRLVELLRDAARPMTIPELLDAAGDLAQSSVYRNLTVLEAAQVVTKVVTTDDFARFELAHDLTNHHHHLICAACGAVRDVEIPPELERTLDTSLAEVAGAHGFTLADHRLDLVGNCGDCR